MNLATQQPQITSPARGVVAGGLLAGTLDLVYAMVLLYSRGRSPLWTLQSVASGALGSSAFEQGLASGLIGLVAQFVISTGAAVTFWLVARKVRLLVRFPVTSGLLFGILVFLFMNFVVLPLSAYPFQPRYPLVALVRGFASHALLVGLPIALSLRYLGAVSSERA